MKYFALRTFVIVLRVIGGLIAAGSILLALILFLIGYSVGDIPMLLANPFFLFAMVVFSILIGFSFFAFADFFEVSIDSALNTERMVNQLDQLIRKD